MKDIEIMDSENTLKEEIAESESKSPEEKNKKKNAVRKTVKKAVAVGVGTGLLTVGAVAALDNFPTHGTGISQITDPDPVVLEIDEADMAGENDSEEEQQEQKKRSIFSWLKLWLYGMITGIVGFFATKIPWKKIFTKRNLIILLILIAVFLFAKYLLPYFADVPWGPEKN